MIQQTNTIIELEVQNHAGVMSHITGLFSRRGFNLEGILCGPLRDRSQSRMFLMVNEDRRLAQLIKELEKLYDVLDVRLRQDVDASVFDPARIACEPCS